MTARAPQVRALADKDTYMSLRGILAAAAVVIASLVSAGAAQPAFAAGGAPGTIDTSFGVGGKVLTNLGTGANGQQIQAGASDAVLQSNGDIVVSGTFGLVRYLPSGTLDTSFGTGGLVPTSFPVAAVNLQPNGEIVAVGTGQGNTASAGTFNVDRFTASGALDPAFGAGGTVTTTFPQTALGDGATTVLAEPDGNILVGGAAGAPGRDNTVVNNGVLALYNPNGTLDQAFGTGGLVFSSHGGQPPILGVDAAGDIFETNGAELSPTGQPFASAMPATIVATSAGGTGTNIAGLRGRAFLPNAQVVDGLAVTTGRRETSVQAEMFNADGTIDTAFFNPAFTFSGAPSSPGAIPAAVAVQANRQIVIAGTNSSGSTSVFGLARLNASGSLDTAFGTNGVLTTTFQGNDHAVAVLIQPSNGDIIVVGQSTNSAGVTDLALARYLG
jgi:uncharacterized delta-60 repeat protein